MTTILAPPTLSPGKLALEYQLGSILHQCSVNFIDGVDLNDETTIAIDALHLANLVKTVLPVTMDIIAWKVLSPEGQTLYVQSFASAIGGTHGTDPGLRAYLSPTIKILGKGVPTNVLQGSGRTSLMIFVSNAYTVLPGEKYLPVIDSPLQDLMDDLNSYLRYWADFYGQHADTTGRVACQFNAHEQKRNGS